MFLLLGSGPGSYGGLSVRTANGKMSHIKSTELIDVMYEPLRDCFGKEVAFCCKDTQPSAARVCVGLSFTLTL